MNTSPYCHEVERDRYATPKSFKLTTQGSDGLLIDAITRTTDGDPVTMQTWGEDGDSLGWCFSTEASDAIGEWSEIAIFGCQSCTEFTEDGHSRICPVSDIDFSEPSNSNDNNYELVGGARILTGAPGGGSALRIDQGGQLAKLPGVNISPSVMSSCTLVIGVYVENIPNTRCWIMGHDNGGYDRNIILSAPEFKGMGMSNSDPISPVWEEETNPPVGEWLHIVAVYHRDAPCHFYVNGVKAPLSPIGDNGEGRPDIYIGGLKHHPNDYNIDGWIKEAKVFARGLGDSEVMRLSNEFFESSITSSVSFYPASVHTSTFHSDMSYVLL